jgi:ribonucleoside-diphosphate reductase alpha subunit
MSYVTKRNGLKEPMHFDKITDRIAKLIQPYQLDFVKNSPWLDIDKENEYMDPVLVAQKVVAGLYSGITTEELDVMSAEICVNMSTNNPMYAYLGGRILISNLHKKTLNNFSDKMILLNEHISIIDTKWLQWVLDNASTINSMINYNRDYLYDYFGFKTLEKSYLLKSSGKIIERPQDMLMRTAITLQMPNIELIKKTYDLMSLGYYTHATPTLFNSGTNHMQLSSCILIGTNDSLNDIASTWNSCAQLSKWACGIGMHVSNVRAKGSLIHGTGGLSTGMVPFLRVFNDIARWIDQGNKRPGSFAVYLEPHHADIFNFLELRKNFGAETERARDLYYALWVSDLFMKQVESNGDWYLMSPDECPGLTDVYGEQYEELYWSYVNAGKFRVKISAQKLWLTILDVQFETGMPYFAFKDSINRKSNQKNIGTIKSSNLCCEIVQYSDHEEYAVCNLASISLKSCVINFKTNPSDSWTIYTKPDCKYCSYAKQHMASLKINYQEIPYNPDTTNVLKHKLNKPSITFPQIFINDTHIGGWSDLYKYTACTFDYEQLYQIAYMATVNLDKVIDINYYPVPQAKKSNMKHRPVGLGIQGLADALVLLRIKFESPEAVQFNSYYMETIYLAALQASCDLAKSRAPLITTFNELCNNLNIKTIPEYYDVNYTIDNELATQLYHQLKPTANEIARLSTIEGLARPGTYFSFDNSPFSNGQLQFDMWETKTPLLWEDKWVELKKQIAKYGVRNSQLTALMPTASTSQILGNNECFEFFTNNIYSRGTQAGDFVMVNKYLVKDLISIGLWSTELKELIIASNGSIQQINQIPSEIKILYKTIWEISQHWVLKQAVARGLFVDQTQSMNIYMAEPDYQRLGSSHMWAWKNGLKTGMYYLRTTPSTNAIKFTVDPNLIKSLKNNMVHPDKQLNDNLTCHNCSA